MRCTTIAGNLIADKIYTGAESVTRLSAARHGMKLVGLFLALGIIAMMGATLTAMAGNASAQSSLTNGQLLVGANTTSAMGIKNDPSASLVLGSEPFDFAAVPDEPSRKNAKKRTRNRCARITTTCWSAA